MLPQFQVYKLASWFVLVALTLLYCFQRALVVGLKGQSPKVVTNKVLPVLRPGEILVKVKAVSLNPADPWFADNRLNSGDSFGCDFAGDIAEVSEGVIEKVNVGDAVAGWVLGGAHDKDNGSFQEYVKILPRLVWPKPPTLSYEDAASMGAALYTSVQAIYYRLDIPKPWTGAASSPAGPVLIWGASSSLGLSAISLIKLSNPSIPVIGTASPHNHELLKSRGVDAVFDYHDADVSEKIKAWVLEHGYEDGIEKAFDTVSPKGSTKLAVAAFGRKGGKIVTVYPAQAADKLNWPSTVLEIPIGSPGALNPANVQDHADMLEWYAHLPALISEGRFSNPLVLKVSQGLEAIPDGLEALRQNKVSATKLAYRL